MDIAPFEDFLTSLSQICPVGFEVRNSKGFLFSSMGKEPDTLLNQTAETLANRVFSQTSVERAPCGDRLTLLGVPLSDGEKTVGSLIAYLPAIGDSQSLKPTAISQEPSNGDMESFLVRLAELIEDKISTHGEVEEMAEELTQSFEDLNLFSRIATQIKSLKFSGSMLKELIGDLLETMRADLAFAVMPERRGYDVMVCNSNTCPEGFDHGAFIDRILKAVPQDEPSLKEKYFIVNDSLLKQGFEELHPAPYRFLSVKMELNNENYGWLGLISFNMAEIFRQSELRLLTSMAEQIAVVIANTDLYHDLEQFVINVVRSLVHTIEAKDYYTRGHSERVNRYAMMMAERLDLGEKQRNTLHWASILHDIGKIGIPESILNKPDRLNDEEYDLIKEHPQKGSEIIKPIDQLCDALPVILHHHERYDGGGYPDGLKGKEIPLLARIISVADTFDAITSTRAYRKAGSPEKALNIMDEVAGSQLDAEFVGLFKEIINRDKCLWEERDHE
ncbi:HD domain-containing phosphohydrolase [Thermodesulfobacteriota bacterium]